MDDHARYYIVAPGYPLSLFMPGMAVATLISAVVIALRLHRGWLWAAAPAAVPLIVVAWSLTGLKDADAHLGGHGEGLWSSTVIAALQWGAQLGVFLTLVALVFAPSKSSAILATADEEHSHG